MILADSAEERLGWRLGKVDEVVGNFYVQRIEARQPEGGDRREGRRQPALLELWLNGEEES